MPNAVSPVPPWGFATRTAACCSSLPEDSPRCASRRGNTEKRSNRDVTLETRSSSVYLLCLKCDLLVPVSAAHLCPPTHDTDFPQRSHALTGEVKEVEVEGEGFFLAVENGGTFYDPCSLSSRKNPTSRFPALQHHQRRCQRKQRSVWSRNKARRERRKVVLDKNTCRSPLHIHHLFAFPVDSELDPGPV